MKIVIPGGTGQIGTMLARAFRAAGHDEAIRLTPHREMGLEDGIEWIADDELVEVTPQSVRLRKKVLKQVERPKKRKE